MTSIPKPTYSADGAFSPERGKRVSVSTLGCKVNTFESALIAQALGDQDWHIVGERDVADVYIINTCTVTREADRQARQAVRRAIRRNPKARVLVTGCYAQMSPQACAVIPGVDLVVGNGGKLDIPELLTRMDGTVDKRSAARIMVSDLDQHVSLPDRLLTGYDGQTRAFVQIQQGCDQSCTFCIIHRARGPSRSLSPAKVLRQVQRLTGEGYKEIVLCGVDLGAYGNDLETDGQPETLAGLLQRICSLEGDFRVRLSSLDPAHIDHALVDLLAGEPRLCPHLHLSLQSGNSLILKRMKRRYTAERATRTVAELRARIPGLVLSADVMAGFPTETEAQFADTVRMVRELGIAYPHVFPYSERSGTPAARIPADKQVPVPERKRRARVLRREGAVVRGALLASRVGDCVRVLVESARCPLAGHVKGRAPDYIEVWVAAPEQSVGRWLDARIDSVGEDVLIARPAG